MTTNLGRGPLRAEPRRNSAARHVRFQKARVIAALVLREMTARYGRSVGGYFWAVAEPAGGIILLALVFSYALFRPPLGNSFVIFYATGIIPFYLYSAVANSVTSSVQQNRGLLTYPVVSALDTVIARVILETLNFMMIAAVLFPLFIYFDRAIVTVQLDQIVLAFAMAAALGLGVGSVNAVIGGFFPTWKSIWVMVNRPMFILSGVMFTYDMIPDPARGWLWYNPVIHVIGQMRMGFFASYGGDYISHVYVFGIGLSLFVVGAYLLRRHEGTLVER